MRPSSTQIPSDPVCGRALNPDGDQPVVVCGKHTDYFCSQTCFDRFMRDSALYARPVPKGFKGLWTRCLGRIRKATDGKPPCCH